MENILFPRFWNEKPALWFAQVESVFALNKIECDKNKYDFIITELHSDIICLIEDVILNPPDNQKYEFLKNEVIVRMSIRELQNEELGDMKPSKFLRHLQHLADRRVKDETIRNIWLKRLPKYVQDIVSVQSSGRLELLSEMADTIINVIPPSSKPADNIAVTEYLNGRFDNLSLQLRTMQGQFRELRDMLLGPQTLSLKCSNTVSDAGSLNSKNQKKPDTLNQQDAVANIQNQVKPQFTPQPSPRPNPNMSLYYQLKNLQGQLEKLEVAFKEKNCIPEKPVLSPEKNNEYLNRSLVHSVASSSHSTPKQNSTPEAKPYICWYHQSYGDKAHHCLAPCTYKEINPTQEKNEKEKETSNETSF